MLSEDKNTSEDIKDSKRDGMRMAGLAHFITLPKVTKLCITVCVIVVLPYALNTTLIVPYFLLELRNTL